MKVIWLFKAEEDGNSLFINELQNNGFNTRQVSPIIFEYCNDIALKDALLKPQNHSGIVLTSPRSVNSVSRQYLTCSVEIHKTWQTKKIFVVGKTTAQAVKDKLELSSIGQETGNIEQLIPKIIEEIKPFEKPLLIPCSNLKNDKLPIVLAKSDRDFRLLTTYLTKPNPTLNIKIQEMLQIEKPDILIFFSPSGVDNGLTSLNNINFDFTSVKFIAIGPTTNAALVNNGIPVCGICSEPTPIGVLQVLKSVI